MKPKSKGRRKSQGPTENHTSSRQSQTMPDYQHWIQQNIVSPAGGGRRGPAGVNGGREEYASVPLVINSPAAMTTRSMGNEGFSEEGWVARDQVRTFEGWAIAGRPVGGDFSVTAPLRPVAPTHAQGSKSPRRAPRQQQALYVPCSLRFSLQQRTRKQQYSRVHHTLPHTPNPPRLHSTQRQDAENPAVESTLTATSLSIGMGSTLESQQQQLMLAQSVYGNLSAMQSQSRLLKDVLSTRTRGLTRVFQEKLKKQLVSATYKQLKLEQQHEKDLASLVAAYDEQFDEFRRYKLQLHQAERRNKELQARLKRMVANHRDDMNELKERSFILEGQLQQSLREETRWKKYASLNATGKQKMLGQQLERKDRELRLAAIKRDEEINVLKKKIKEMRKSHAEESMEIRCVGLGRGGWVVLGC